MNTSILNCPEEGKKKGKMKKKFDRKKRGVPGRIEDASPDRSGTAVRHSNH